MADEIDKLLGSFNQGLSLVNDNVEVTGVCEDCHEPITIQQEAVKAGHKLYHKDHFRCVFCKQPIPNREYYLHENGNIYCTKDYLENVLDKCHACNKPMTDTIVKAGDMCYHPDCFKCSVCEKKLSGMYSLHNGKLLCKEDYDKVALPTCGKCGKVIGKSSDAEEAISYVSLQEKTYHTECFVCKVCLKPFPNGKVWIHNEDLYCQTDIPKNGKIVEKKKEDKVVESKEKA